MSNKTFSPSQRPNYATRWHDKLFKVPHACEISGIGRTRMFELFASGEVQALRNGGVNLVVGESLGRYVDGLPEWRSGS